MVPGVSRATGGCYSVSRTLKRVVWATLVLCGWYSVLRAAGELPCKPASASDPLPKQERLLPEWLTDGPSTETDGEEQAAPAQSEEKPATLLKGLGERIDAGAGNLLHWKEREKLNVRFGAWHWFHQSLIGRGGGYGIPGLRGTYWYEILSDYEHDLGGGQAVGAHLNYRLRDGDPFRPFFTTNFWSYEAYGYFQDEQWGTFKAGQIWRRFGLDWDGSFWGNTAYFDGFKLNPDYGLAWERTRQIDPALHVDTFAQFFLAEDGVNGSFAGGDSESVPGFNRRNTGNVRLVPTWTIADDQSLAVGVSAMAGQIRSRRADVGDQLHSAWAIDATYRRGPWTLMGEGMQSFGVIHPERFISGGPSNRITNFLVEAHYTAGPITYRLGYSHGIDANPHAQHTLVRPGITAKLTEHVDFYLEYVNQQVHGNADEGHITFFNGLEFIVYWQY